MRPSHAPPPPRPRPSHAPRRAHPRPQSYVIALSNKAAAAHRSATAQLASSRIASKVMERQGELLGNPIGDLSIGSFVVGVTQGLLASFANWLSNRRAAAASRAAARAAAQPLSWCAVGGAACW